MDFLLSPAALFEKEVIRSLLQPYLEELSQLPGENPPYKDSSGMYHYSYLNAYWQESDRFPYLIFVEEKPGGFALVSKHDNQWKMAEFYVRPEFRRQGIGEKVALGIFYKHPGDWHISFNKHNVPGRRLWKKLAGQFTRGVVEETKLDSGHNFVCFSVEIMGLS